MGSDRTAVPDRTKKIVLEEYNYRCAICGVAVPQLHHIDGVNTNHNSQNLLPVCPNCHLLDQHNPTKKIDKYLLGFFREYKDPLILSPQFLPLWHRTRFLENMHDRSSPAGLQQNIKDLADFISSLNQGAYYASRIIDMLTPRWDVDNRAELRISAAIKESQINPPSEMPSLYEKMRQLFVWFNVGDGHGWGFNNEKWPPAEYIFGKRDEIYKLIVELTRYQAWETPKLNRWN